MAGLHETSGAELNEVPASPVRLLTTADVRRLVEGSAISPTKKRGQNFVTDANTVRRIVRTAEIGPTDVVVEIGPGLGSLTLGLLEVAQRVVAVEIDEKLADLLPATINECAPESIERFELVNADALRITELPGPAPTALVANLPYNVSVPVLLHFLATFESLRSVLVMVQAEVGERLAANPGSRIYGIPSVKAAWWADVSLAGAVGRNVFWPTPNVDSVLVRLERRDPPNADRAATFALVDAAFAQRRKTLRAALSGIAGSADRAEAALRAAGIDPRMRGEQLTVEDFARLSAHIRPAGVESPRIEP